MNNPFVQNSKTTVKPESKADMDNPFAQEPKASLSWLWQVITGAGLVVLLGLHFVAQHFIAKGGLRDFAEVLAYLRNPVFLVLEVLFLIFVASHAMLGVRAILMDFGLSDRTEKRLTQALTVVGVLTVGYGMWLTWAIIH
jgi:succinate dehydrogenase hydrophobic anchor subunit